jgi:Cu(I)/Ag(I) efflux system membrane protein CusA/SilA
MINSENAMLRGSVLFNVRDRDLGTVEEAQDKLNTMMTKLPKGYYVEWSGQWENQIRANKTLSLILPIVLIIFLILYFTYKSKEALITMITVPFCFNRGFYGLFMGLIYLWPLQSGLSHFWDGDRNSYDNDYLLERGHEQDG